MRKKYKILLLIVLLIGFTCSEKTFAQWSFSYNVTGPTTGFCVADKRAAENTAQACASKPMPTERECNRWRDEALKINQQHANCGVKITCSKCVGSSAPNSSSSSTSPFSEIENFYGKVNINGTNMGEPYFTPDPANKTYDWASQKEFEDEVLDINNNSTTLRLTPQIGNKEVDDLYLNLSDQSDKYFNPNWKPRIVEQPSAPILPKNSMKIAEYKHNMQVELAELNRIKRFCKAKPSDCSYYQNRIDKANKQLEDAKEELRKLYNDNIYETEIARIEKQVNDRSLQMSRADKKEEIADECLRRINEQLEKGEISKNDAAQQLKTAYEDKIAAISERKITEAYASAKDFIQEKKEITKDFWENSGEYFSDERVEKAFSHLGVEAVTLALPPIISVGYNSAANQHLNGEKIDIGRVGKDIVKGFAKDKVLGQVPYVLEIETTLNIGGKLWNVGKAVNEVRQEKIQNKQ